jgi:DNA-directed RNA polymerase subunit RPC12/RpoP
MDKIEIRCPECNKWIAEKDKDVTAKGIYFWCARCKKKIIIENNRAQVANELK